MLRFIGDVLVAKAELLAAEFTAVIGKYFCMG